MMVVNISEDSGQSVWKEQVRNLLAGVDAPGQLERLHQLINDWMQQDAPAAATFVREIVASDLPEGVRFSVGSLLPSLADRLYSQGDTAQARALAGDLIWKVNGETAGELAERLVGDSDQEANSRGDLNPASQVLHAPLREYPSNLSRSPAASRLFEKWQALMVSWCQESPGDTGLLDIFSNALRNFPPAYSPIPTLFMMKSDHAGIFFKAVMSRVGKEEGTNQRDYILHWAAHAAVQNLMSSPRQEGSAEAPPAAAAVIGQVCAEIYMEISEYGRAAQTLEAIFDLTNHPGCRAELVQAALRLGKSVEYHGFYEAVTRIAQRVLAESSDNPEVRQQAVELAAEIIEPARSKKHLMTAVICALLVRDHGSPNADERADLEERIRDMADEMREMKVVYFRSPEGLRGEEAAAMACRALRGDPKEIDGITGLLGVKNRQIQH